MLASSVMLAIALATIFITDGLLRMKSWAFFAAIVVNLLIVAEAILRFAAGNGGLSGTLLPLAVIVYLAVFARPTYFARPQE
jgi:4-hydroxybenzoate polyprenyltransferase